MHVHSRPAWRRRFPRCLDVLPYISWLRDPGSLTARLQRKGAFSIHLRAQGLGFPTRDEALELGISEHCYVWVREVSLLIDGQPVVFAHTILPTFPRGPLTRWLARLGSRSLGSMLFSHPEFSRGRLTARRLDSRHPLHARSADALQLPMESRLWARRSRFDFGRQSILVTEVFSPRLVASIPAVTKTPHS